MISQKDRKEVLKGNWINWETPLTTGAERFGMKIKQQKTQTQKEPSAQPKCRRHQELERLVKERQMRTQ